MAHPLDPLTEPEVAAAVGALRAAGRITERSRFAAITLHEPDKQVVRSLAADAADAEVPRRAEAIVIDRATGTSAVAVVDVVSGAVTSWEVIDGHAMLLLEEMWESIT